MPATTSLDHRAAARARLARARQLLDPAKERAHSQAQTGMAFFLPYQPVIVAPRRAHG
jgi:hypothetical protein